MTATSRATRKGVRQIFSNVFGLDRRHSERDPSTERTLSCAPSDCDSPPEPPRTSVSWNSVPVPAVMSGTSGITKTYSKEGSGRRRLRLPRLGPYSLRRANINMAAGSRRQQHREALWELAPGCYQLGHLDTRDSGGENEPTFMGRANPGPFSRRRSRSFSDRDLPGCIRQATRKIWRINSLGENSSVERNHSARAGTDPDYRKSLPAQASPTGASQRSVASRSTRLRRRAYCPAKFEVVENQPRQAGTPCDRTQGPLSLSNLQPRWSLLGDSDMDGVREYACHHHLDHNITITQ